MDDQRIENLLNLSLDAAPEEREKSIDLNVGYDPQERTWELIVRYHGDIEAALDESIEIIKLIDGYAILTVPESLVDALANVEEIDYIEKPKRLFFAENLGKLASCISRVQAADYNLLGEGVIVAIIDSGIDYTHPDFRNEDGSTRILDLWDQTIPGNPPEGYTLGSHYTSEEINEALEQPNVVESLEIVPSVDISGHGTHVAGIAAGNGRASQGRYRGVAPRSDLIIVKLGTPRVDSFPRTTELMQAVNFVVERALFHGKPVAINLSFGNSYGSHDGSSLIETYLNDISNIGRSVIVIGTGNEGGSGGHTSGILQNNISQSIQFAVGNFEQSISLQIWKNFVDEINIMIRDPGGTTVGPLQRILGTQRFTMGDTELLIYFGEPSPYSTAQEIYIEFLPNDTYIESGIWEIILVPEIIVVGEYDIWLPGGGILNPETKFLRPTETTTLTIPSTASYAISVGAYDPVMERFAEFSGRGYTRATNQVKPDLVAPGVNITSTSPGGGYTTRSGTSMATPFVTGSAALLMEWGILDGNDPFMYGEKVKAYLIAGARKLSVERVYPNPTLGYGALCLRDSFRWAGENV